MLQSLHVKNLALIKETEVEFKEGLNILTGETGAGKSVLIGSINLALGAKFDKDMLHKGADTALVELVFQSEDEKVWSKMEEMGFSEEEDGTIIISRRIQTGRSIFKMNGETVTSRQVKEVAELLLDIHGQHEHQSLLHKRKHMEILDAYCGEAFQEPSRKVAELYRECRRLKQRIEEEAMDEESKARERSLAEFEYQEIEDAKLTKGEDEELEQKYRRMRSSGKIMESLVESRQYTGSELEGGAGVALSRALRALRSVTAYDEGVARLEEQLAQIDSLLADYSRDAADYMSDLDFDQEDFNKTEARLNEINRLKGKYGKTIEEVLSYASSRLKMLNKLADYDAYMESLEMELKEKSEMLEEACRELSSIRKSNGEELTVKLKSSLLNLNFLTVEFEVAVRKAQTISATGYDDIEFLISTNPGEDKKPLSQVASGGELSRIMLAIKTVLAGKDSIDTLIFDEIDSGISGKTAWKVSEQLNEAARAHQVICITHLPQIAAMADAHFIIEKSSTDDNTITDIYYADEEVSLSELARMLGSDMLTEAAINNAGEMKAQAVKHKAF